MSNSADRQRRYRQRQKKAGRTMLVAPVETGLLARVRRFAREAALSLPDAIEHLLRRGLRAKKGREEP